ncbi:30S ribosomal protein S1 [bacterium]|nr:30S ribosomal protein S1 [bacterium]
MSEDQMKDAMFDEEKNSDIPEDEPREESTEEDDEFAALLDQHLPESAPKTMGELFDATVVGILEDAVLLDYGSKEEAAIAIGEFLDARGNPTVNIGDRVRILMTGWDENGNPDMSYRKARAAQAVRMVAEAWEKKVPVRGVISEAVKGGVVVDIGMRAFMPGSHVDLFRVGDLSTMVGQDIEAHILDFDPDRKRVVLSRRQLLAERREKSQLEFLSTVAAGQNLKGKVRDVLDFGAFVELEGGAEGLVPRSELSWDRASHPSEIVAPGQEIDVKVLDVSPETGKITLSRKRLNRDPWETINDIFPAGSTVKGKVVGIQSFGAFVQLQEGITGLLHVSDLSWESSEKKVEDEFQVGDEVTCQVIEVDQEKKRLSLSLKHLSRDPWMDIEAQYPVGTRHKGTVTGLREFGAFVKISDNVEGLLHISDLSWTTRPNHPSDLLKEGQEIEVVVLELDRNRRRISLGMKQLSESPFQGFVDAHPAGSVVNGKVTRVAGFGAFVEVAPGVEGLVHISELDVARVESAEKVVRVDQEIPVKVLKIDPDKGRISLSRKQALDQIERENIKQYMKKEDEKTVGSGLGDLLRAAMEKKGKK